MKEIMPPHVNGAGKGVIGLLRYLNYNVESGGPNDLVRRSRLEYIYSCELLVEPGTANAKYVAEFGESSSEERFEKIVRVIESNLDRFSGNTSNAWLECIRKWEDDLDWFFQKFGERHGHPKYYFEN